MTEAWLGSDNRSRRPGGASLCAPGSSVCHQMLSPAQPRTVQQTVLPIRTWLEQSGLRELPRVSVQMPPSRSCAGLLDNRVCFEPDDQLPRPPSALSLGSRRQRHRPRQQNLTRSTSCSCPCKATPKFPLVLLFHPQEGVTVPGRP